MRFIIDRCCGKRRHCKGRLQLPEHSKSLGYKSLLLIWTMLRISYVILQISTWSELSAQRVPELCPVIHTQTAQVPWANSLKPSRANFIHFDDLYMLPDYSFVNSSKLKVTKMTSWYGAAFCIIGFLGGWRVGVGVSGGGEVRGWGGGG